MTMPLRSPTRVFRFGPYVVELWALEEEPRRGRSHYAFSFFDDEWSPEAVFERWDYMAPEWETYENVALGLLYYLSVQKDEEESFFFRDYTPAQLTWRDARAADLRRALKDLEEAREAGISGKEKRRPQMGGIFDVFLPPEEREEKKREREGLPAPKAPPALPGPPPKKGLIQKVLAPFSLIAPEPEEVPIAPLPTREVPERAPELWEALVPADVREAAERKEREVPLEELFAPSVVFEEPGIPAAPTPMGPESMRRAFPERWRFFTPAVTGEWTPPTAQQSLERLREMLNIDDIINSVRGIRQTPEFQKQLASEAAEGRAGIIWLEPITEYETFGDLAAFFGIPWEIVERYLRGTRTEQEEREQEERLWIEVFDPAAVSLSEAFELVKPTDLPGWFAVDIDRATDKHWLTYAEAELPALR